MAADCREQGEQGNEGVSPVFWVTAQHPTTSKPAQQPWPTRLLVLWEHPCQLQATFLRHCCVYDPCLISACHPNLPLNRSALLSILTFLFFFSVQMLFSVFLIFCSGHHHCSFWSVYTQFCVLSCNVEWLQLWVLGCPTGFIFGLCSLMNCYLLMMLLLICRGSWGIKLFVWYFIWTSIGKI